jgi:hypothetical protein
MIYAIDGDKLQSMTSKKAFLKIFKRSGNIYYDDFLTYDFKMKFDLIVGNPPYQESKDSGGGRKDQASNLWSKFWVKSLERAYDNGKVVLITPSSWISPSADLKGKNKFNGQSRLWDVFDSYSSYANVTDVAKYFPGIGSTFSLVIVDKSGRNGLTFSNGEDTSLGFLPKSNHIEVFHKLNKNNNIGSHYLVNQDNKPTLRVSVPLTRVLDSDSVQILNGEEKPTSGSDKEKLYLYAYCDTLEEAKHIQERVISCIDILNTHCRWSGFMNIQVFKMIKI